MKQIFRNYLEWEDYLNGMFELPSLKDNFTKVTEAKDLLSNPDKFYATLKQMMQDWPVCTSVNMTNLGQNRKAWLGAAACSYLLKAPETVTRIAWGLLTKEEQTKANLVATRIINEYKTTQTYAKTLFEYQCA